VFCRAHNSREVTVSAHFRAAQKSGERVECVGLVVAVGCWWVVHGGEGGVVDVRLVRAVVAGCAVVCGVRGSDTTYQKQQDKVSVIKGLKALVTLALPKMDSEKRRDRNAQPTQRSLSPKP